MSKAFNLPVMINLNGGEKMITKQWSILLMACLIAVGLFSAFHSNAYGTTYYVDYVNGLDSYSGTSLSAPWKHCPGDANATGNANITLQPGDTVNFKGGVKYRGTINMGATSGTLNNVITYTTGSGWGSGRAIITGADPFPNSWTACASQAACRNNPNWQQIYTASIPAGMGFYNRLFQNGQFLYWAQSPVPPTNLLDWTNGWRQAASVPGATKTSLTDSAFFTQSDPTYWNEAYIAIWITGNEFEVEPITGYTPATNTITYSLNGTAVWNSSYAVLNQPDLITQAGQYAISANDGKIYLWPTGSLNPNTQTIEWSSRKEALGAGANVSYVTINNLEIYGTSGDPNIWYAGSGINLSGGGTSTNITVTNCLVHWLSSMAGMNSIRISSNNALEDSNTVENVLTNRGILNIGGTNVTVSNNTINNTGGTGIWFMSVTNGTMVGNTVSNILGIHSNGVSVYSSSANILIDKNTITNSGSLLTFEQSSNLMVSNNIIDGYGIGSINEWGSMSGYINFINNTMVNGAGPHNILRFYTPNQAATRTVINNVLDGFLASGVGIIHSYNIFTGSPMNLSEGEQNISDLTTLFVNPVAKDFYPKAGGPLINTGADVSAYGVFTDIQRIRRPQGSAWDIGAYEANLGLKVLSPPIKPTTVK